MNYPPTRLFKISGLFLIGTMAIGVWWGYRNSLHQSGAANQPSVATIGSPDHDSLNRSQAHGRPASGYIGSAACAECHAGIAESYRHHPMANSMWEVSTAPELEDYKVNTSFSPDGKHVYSIEKTSQGVHHRERLVSAEGEELFSQSARIDYAVGSGAQGRSYLLQKGDILLMSPISWYSSLQKWSLSPGYHLPDHKRFSRRVREACLDCHAGRLNSLPEQDDHFGTPAFHELSIGCERCHGPAEAHVAHHRDATETSLPDPIVNPAKLDRQRREAVCSQCHLQGEGRIPNAGNKIGDYRPGQRMEETCLVIVRDDQDSPTASSRVVSHVEQMMSSVCYIKSGGELGCTSCHDPHSVPSEHEKVSHYRQRCMKCHQDQNCSLPDHLRLGRQPDDSCVVCHMPSFGASDVPHAANSDHRILRNPSAKPLPDAGARSVAPGIFGQADMLLEKPVLDRALGIWMAQRAFDTVDYRLASKAVILLTPVVDRMPADAEAQEAMGLASSILGREEPAITFFRKTLQIEPDRELALLMLASGLDRSGRSEEALPILEKCLEIDPAKASTWNLYSIILEKVGMSDQAIAAARHTVDLDPSKPIYYQRLALLLEQAGEPLEAQSYSKHAELIRQALERTED